MNGYCDGGRYGCGSPATFVARCEDVMPGDTWLYDSGVSGYEPRELSVTFEACGHHLTALIAAYPIPSPTSTRFIVVPCNPNVSALPEPD